MTPVINLYAVVVADFIGLSIFLLILATKGWNLPGRKEESHILLRMLIVSIVNCIVDALVSAFDGRVGPGHEFYHAVLLAGNSYLYAYNVIVGGFLVHMIVKHIDRSLSRLQKILLWFISIVQSILLIINLFYPVVFKIDTNNEYHRGQFFFVFIVSRLPLVIYGYVYYFSSKIKNPALRYFPVFEFLLPILVGMLIHSTVYGISLLPACFFIPSPPCP